MILIRLVLLFICYFLCQLCVAQTIIYKDSDEFMRYMDSAIANEYLFGIDTSFKEPFLYRYWFKEKLPDGIYYYVEKPQKDSLKVKKDLDNIYVIKAVYVDSVRNGEYLEYIKSSYAVGVFTKRKRALQFQSNFKNGKLHGLIRYQNVLGQTIYEGNYKNGEKHGFFYEYDPKGNLVEVRLYDEGELLYVSEYRNPTVISHIDSIEESELNDHRILRYRSNDQE